MCDRGRRKAQVCVMGREGGGGRLGCVIGGEGGRGRLRCV